MNIPIRRFRRISALLILTVSGSVAALGAEAIPTATVVSSERLAVITAPATHPSGVDGRVSLLASLNPAGQVSLSLQVCPTREPCEIHEGIDPFGQLTVVNQMDLRVVGTVGGIAVDLLLVHHARSGWYQCVDTGSGKVALVEGLDVYWSTVSGSIGEWIITTKTCGAWGSQAVAKWISTNS